MNHSDPLKQQIESLQKRFQAVETDADRLRTSITRHIAHASPSLKIIEKQAAALHNKMQSTGRDSSAFFQHVSQLAELIQISALITSSLELDDVLTGVLDTIIRLTGAERASIWLRPVDGFEFEPQAARDADQCDLAQDALPVSLSMIQAATEKRQPLVTINASEDERFDKLQSVILNELRSVIVIPLILRDEVLGALYADNRMAQGVFSEENFTILTAFANQAAIAISNARLFEHLRGYLRDTQQELLRLSIQIDEQVVEENVKQITQTDIFKKLRNMRRGSLPNQPDKE